MLKAFSNNDKNSLRLDGNSEAIKYSSDIFERITSILECLEYFLIASY